MLRALCGNKDLLSWAYTTRCITLVGIEDTAENVGEDPYRICALQEYTPHGV